MQVQTIADLVISIGLACMLAAFYYDWKHYRQEMAGKSLKEKFLIQFNLFHHGRNRKKSLLFSGCFILCLFIYAGITA